jgi:uncharacterized protein (DUF362 family)
MGSFSEVFVLRSTDRAKAIPALLEKLGLDDYSGKTVALKANFNSADLFPASTHIDTLRAVVEALKASGARGITLAERSGMGDTRQVLEDMGVFALSKELGFNAVVLDEVAKADWVKVDRGESHWLRGFYLAKVFRESAKVVQTCCLKTHHYGGHFTLSLKNSVGLIAKKLPSGFYDYMWELHSSPFQRQMIAEINCHYNVDAILMDGIKAFVTGGPDKGTLVEPNLLLASRDRVAIDAIGFAILKMYGAKSIMGETGIFEQDQLKRAAQLGIGVTSADQIKLTPLNDETRADTERIDQILKEPPVT